MYFPSTCNGEIVTIVPELLMVTLLIRDEIAGIEKRVPVSTANAIRSV